jgi:hypothetical protein
MAPKKMIVTQKNTEAIPSSSDSAASSVIEEEITPVVVAAEEPKKKGGKKKQNESEAEPHSSSESDDSSATAKADKKKRKVPLSKVLEMLKKGDVAKATAALEVLVGEKKDKKQREPSAFNKFVKEKMAELKETTLSTKEKMGKCAEMWKEQKAAAM